MDLLNPDPADVRSADIAHALSLINRYTGHSRTGYSVAAHSVHVMRLAPEALKPYALLHDAAEAYLGDWSTILKLTVDAQCERRCANPLRILAARMQNAIMLAFGLGAADGDFAEHENAIKHADRAALTLEHAALMPPLTGDERLFWPFVDVEPDAPRPMIWADAEAAEAAFDSALCGLGLRAVGDPK